MSMENQGKSKSATTTDIKKSQCDNQMDSGFMSGSNLLSSSSLCPPEDVTPCDKDAPEDTVGLTDNNPGKYENIATDFSDSGLDLGLSDSICSLKLTSEPEDGVHQPPKQYLQPTETRPTCTMPTISLAPVHLTILKEIFKKDDDGDTQLHIAVMRGFYEVVWHITRLLPHQALLDIPNNSGRTALHLAVAGGNTSLTRHLIVCGASPVARNLKGDTALHVACSNGDYSTVSTITSQVTNHEVVQARLSYSPNHTPGLLAADFNNYDGQTCIHVSAKGAHKQILQHLTWYGADINAKECKCGRTALHIAVESRDADLIRFLSETCRAALSIQTYAGLTPYQLAMANDAQTIATLLEELGATKETLPVAYAVEDDPDNDEDSANFGNEDLSWQESGIQIGGVNFPYSNATAVPVSTHGPFNADRFL